jgi:hypothetical protein
MDIKDSHVHRFNHASNSKSKFELYVENGQLPAEVPVVRIFATMDTATFVQFAKPARQIVNTERKTEFTMARFAANYGAKISSRTSTKAQPRDLRKM